LKKYCKIVREKERKKSTGKIKKPKKSTGKKYEKKNMRNKKVREKITGKYVGK
jgi:hypothetical protein